MSPRIYVGGLTSSATDKRVRLQSCYVGRIARSRRHA